LHPDTAAAAKQAAKGRLNPWCIIDKNAELIHNGTL